MIEKSAIGQVRNLFCTFLPDPDREKKFATVKLLSEVRAIASIKLEVNDVPLLGDMA